MVLHGMSTIPKVRPGSQPCAADKALALGPFISSLGTHGGMSRVANSIHAPQTSGTQPNDPTQSAA
eukprot:518705-Pelagomonas_calceolata.AAC.4